MSLAPADTHVSATWKATLPQLPWAYTRLPRELRCLRGHRRRTWTACNPRAAPKIAFAANKARTPEPARPASP